MTLRYYYPGNNHGRYYYRPLRNIVIEYLVIAIGCSGIGGMEMFRPNDCCDCDCYCDGCFVLPWIDIWIDGVEAVEVDHHLMLLIMMQLLLMLWKL